MRAWRAVVLVPTVLIALGGCADDEPRPDSSGSAAPTGPSETATTGDRTPQSPSSATPTPTQTQTPLPRHRERDPDPRWQFFTDDRRWLRSPWYAGAHRIMIGFGCNPAPWYDPDPRCPGSQGFHHGIDVAMSCGTRLRAGRTGAVLPLDAPGSPGTAYGENPVRIRTADGRYDVLIGHTRQVYVEPGETVRAGALIARASDSAAPDGCHLHFEVRPAGGDVSTAVDPARWLRLRAAG